MPNLKKIKINNSNIFDIFNADNLLAGTNIGIVEYDDGSVDLSTLTYGVEYILGTQSSATNVWLGTSTDLGCNNGTLYNGKVIIYHLPYNGNTSPATLNLTLADGSITGDINVKYLSGTNVTNEFSAGYDIFMIYDGTLWKTSASGTSKRTLGIPFGRVDSTSTATAYTATVPGITELVDGTCVMLENGVVTSAAGFTLNINGLGAKPVFNNLTAATRDTTIFNVNYTMLFVYDSNRVVDSITGAWCCYRGYDANTNTIGYQLRSNSYSKAMTDITYRYRLLFSSADNSKWVPANTSSSTDATASKTVCQTPINPFGEIVYYSTTASVAAGSRPSATNLWLQYTLSLGYSFNRTGVALTLTSWKPVYVKCAPQADGSAIIDSTTPYVQDLPSIDDGKIYIFLGVAYSATAIELLMNHPVFYYKDGAIRQWSNAYIPAAVQSNWNETNTSSAAYIQNKPTIPDDSTLVHKSGNESIGGQKTFSSKIVANGGIDVGQGTVSSEDSQDFSYVTTGGGDTLQDALDAKASISAVNAKQDALVSGTNIKTVNNTSLLGSGNVSVGTITGITMNGSSKGTSGVVDLGTVLTAHQDISGKANAADVYTKIQVDTALGGKQDEIASVTVAVDANTGTPIGTVSFNNNTLAFSFQNLKGETGAAGPQGVQGATGPQGPQGNSGYSGAAGELEVVNNYTEGGATAALSAEAGKQMYIDLGAEVSENYTRYEYPSIFGNYYFNASSLASNGGFWCTEPIIVHDGETITSPVTSNTALATVAADQLPLTSSSVITRIGQNAAATYTNNTGADVYVIISYERNRSYGISITGNSKEILTLSGLDGDVFQTQNVVSLPKRENISVGKFAAAGLAANPTGGYWYQYGNAVLLLTTPIALKSGDILHVTTTLGTYLVFARVPQGETQSSSTHYIGMWSQLTTDQKKNASIKVDEDMDIVFYCNANELKEVWVEHPMTEMMTSEMVYPVIANECLVRCQDSDVCLIMGSSLTHNDYSPKSMSWIERVNDLVDIGIVNGGHSGVNLSGNITDMTTGTINLLGVSLSSLKPRYIVSNNDANSTPTGSSLDEQLKQFGQIAKGVGATWLVCGEEPTLINAGKYNRQAAMTMQGVNYFPSALLWYNLNRTQSYAGWLDSSRVHSNMKNGSSHVAMVEMLEKLYIHKSVKFYKIRENYKNGSPTTSDLVYSSRIERAKKWRATCPAIGNGTSPWANDNIDGTGYISGETAGVDLMTDTTITSEVATAKGGGNITFYKHALCEIIVPRIQVTQATITMNCSVTPTGVGYIANGAYVPVTPTYADGVLTITLSAANIQNYDKICLVISDTTDATFTLGGVKCVIADGQEKPSYKIEYRGRKSGTELMTKTSVETGWTFSGNGSVKQLPSAVRNYTALNNVANHIQLDDDSATASYTQSIGRQVHKVAVRIAATIWPLIQTVRTSNDYTTTTQNLFRGMYYGGDLLLTINDAYIPLHIESGWMEVYAEAVIDSDSLSIKLGRFTNFDASYNIGGYPVMIHNVSVQEISA